jgi:hypothetical protein
VAKEAEFQKKPEEMARKELSALMNAYLRPLRRPPGKREANYAAAREKKLEQLQKLKAAGWKEEVGAGSGKMRSISSVALARAQRKLADLEAGVDLLERARKPREDLREVFVAALPYIVERLGIGPAALRSVGVPQDVIYAGLGGRG